MCCATSWLYQRQMHSFRDKRTGRLRKEMVFVVDNGPAEQPSSHLVQMCLVWLLNFLQLDKLTQVSFAEYHSKRNFVKRVHAEENHVLSKHSPFDSKPLHKRATAGSKEHAENMESVAEEVRKFRGHLEVIHCSATEEWNNQIMCSMMRKNYKFSFAEQRGQTLLFTINLLCTGWEHYECLVMVWNLDPNFTGDFVKDHQEICNTLKYFTTSWMHG